MLCVRDDTRVAGHGSCNGRGAVVSCGGISAPVLLRFGGVRHGLFEPAKSEKSGGVEFCRYAPQATRGVSACLV